MKSILKFSFGLLMVAYGALSYGFLIYKYYYWFFYPLFPLVEINYAVAIALRYCAIPFIANSGNNNIKDEYKTDLTEQYIEALLMPWVLLFMGWLVSLFLDLKPLI